MIVWHRLGRVRVPPLALTKLRNVLRFHSNRCLGCYVAATRTEHRKRRSGSAMPLLALITTSGRSRGCACDVHVEHRLVDALVRATPAAGVHELRVRVPYGGAQLLAGFDHQARAVNATRRAPRLRCVRSNAVSRGRGQRAAQARAADERERAHRAHSVRRSVRLHARPRHEAVRRQRRRHQTGIISRKLVRYKYAVAKGTHGPVTSRRSESPCTDTASTRSVPA
jgi:hypothetical protein